MANPFAELFNRLFGPGPQPGIVNEQGQIVPDPNPAPQQNPVTRLIEENITGPLGINAALEQYAQSLGQAQASQVPTVQTPVSSEQLAAEADPLQRSQLRAQNREALAGNAQAQIVDEILPHIVALIETGGAYWDEMPPDVQQAVTRGVNVLTGAPVTNALVPQAEVALAGGGALEQLAAAARGLVRNPSLPPRSYSEIEGIDPALAVVLDVATGLPGGIGEVAVGAEGLSRLPMALSATRNTISNVALDNLMRQTMAASREALATNPVFAKLSPREQENAINLFMLGGPSSGERFNELIARNGLTPDDAGQLHAALSQTVPSLPEHLPEALRDGGNRLFEGMDDDEANQVFNELADEGGNVAPSREAFLGAQMDEESMIRITVRMTDAYDQIGKRLNELSEIARTRPLTSVEAQKAETLFTQLRGIGGVIEAANTTFESGGSILDFLDNMRAAGATEKGVEGITQWLTGFGEADALADLRLGQAAAGGQIMEDTGLATLGGNTLNVEPLEPDVIRSFLEVGQPLEMTTSARGWLDHIDVGARELAEDGLMPPELSQEITTRLAHLEALEGEIAPADVLAVIDNVAPEYADDILRRAERDRIQIEGVKRDREVARAEQGGLLADGKTTIDDVANDPRLEYPIWASRMISRFKNKHLRILREEGPEALFDELTLGPTQADPEFARRYADELQGLANQPTAARDELMGIIGDDGTVINLLTPDESGLIDPEVAINALVNKNGMERSDAMSLVFRYLNETYNAGGPMDEGTMLGAAGLSQKVPSLPPPDPLEGRLSMMDPLLSDMYRAYISSADDIAPDAFLERIGHEEVRGILGDVLGYSDEEIERAGILARSFHQAEDNARRAVDSPDLIFLLQENLAGIDPKGGERLAEIKDAGVNLLMSGDDTRLRELLRSYGADPLSIRRVVQGIEGLRIQNEVGEDILLRDAGLSRMGEGELSGINEADVEPGDLDELMIQARMWHERSGTDESFGDFLDRMAGDDVTFGDMLEEAGLSREEGVAGEVVGPAREVETVTGMVRRWQVDNPATRDPDDPRAQQWLRDNPDKITAYFEGDASPAELIDLPGARGEHENIDPELVARAKERLQSQGFDPDQPIMVRVAQDGTATIWEGNHRLRAAQELGMENVPIYVFYEGGSEAAADSWKSEALRQHLGGNP